MHTVLKLKEVAMAASTPKIPHPESTGFAATATKSVELKKLNQKSMSCRTVLFTVNTGYNSRVQTTCRNKINASNRDTTEAARDDDNQNTKNEIVFSLSKFCHKIFKYRKAFLDYLDDYTD